MSKKSKKAVMKSISIDIASNGYAIDVNYNYESDKDSDRYIAVSIKDVLDTVQTILESKK